MHDAFHTSRCRLVFVYACVVVVWSSAGVALPSFKDLVSRLPPFARSERAHGNTILRELLTNCKRREVRDTRRLC